MRDGGLDAPDFAQAPPPDGEPPELVGHWTFGPEAGLEDATGRWDPFELYGVARVEDGALWVDGYLDRSRGFARTTGFRGRPLREKTFVVWVAPQGLDAFGGAAISLSSRELATHDALVFGVAERLGWTVATGGRVPSNRDFVVPHAEAVTRQVSVSWRPLADGQAEVTLCSEGEMIGSVRARPTTWAGDGTELLVGTSALATEARGAMWTVGGLRSVESGGLDARIDEVRLYRGVLSCAEAAGLVPEPDSPPDPPAPETPELIGQWAFTPGAEREDSTGHWDPLEVYGTVGFEGGAFSGHFGRDGFARAVGWTGGLIRDKTFVAWVTHRSRQPHGGGALALDSRFPMELKFDTLAWFVGAGWAGWTAAQDGRENRGYELLGDGAEPGVKHQVAISWADIGGTKARITLCYEGERVGHTDHGPMANWADEAEVLIGVRNLTYQAVGPYEIDGERQLTQGELDAEIDEVRLYRGALPCDAVSALVPVP